MKLVNEGNSVMDTDELRDRANKVLQARANAIAKAAAAKPVGAVKRAEFISLQVEWSVNDQSCITNIVCKNVDWQQVKQALQLGGISENRAGKIAKKLQREHVRKALLKHLRDYMHVHEDQFYRRGIDATALKYHTHG